jgi:hypothetical protein
LSRPALLAYLLGGIPLAVSAAVLSHWLPTPAGETPFEELIRGRNALLVVAPFVVLLGPVFEELVIRGFLFAAIERPHGSLPAVLVTSAIFSLLHGWQYAWQWQSLLLLSGAGILLGTVRARTQSVVPSTLLHAGYNATLFAGLFVFGDQMFGS